MMRDLPPELVHKILSRIPITSLREVRSTCKLWDALSKEWVLGKAAAARQFVGFMTMDDKVWSMRFHVGKDQDLVDEISIKQVDLLNHVKISQVFYCDGLVLCVAKDKSRLVVWNPYLGQTRWIGPRTSFYRLDRYALGYDKNNNRTHKIFLRFVNYICYNIYLKEHFFGYEIYDLSSDSWRVLDVNPDWNIEFDHRGASLKGNSYFIARDKVEELEDFLLCFDFTTEKFGPRLPLPFHSYDDEPVAFSCVGEEQLAVLYQQQREDPFDMLGVWVTTMIEPNAVSWMKFLKLDMNSYKYLQLRVGAVSFFIDEEKKLAVIFDVDEYRPTETGQPHHTALIIGDDGYFRYVSLGEAPSVCCEPDCVGYSRPVYRPALVCSSSYLPSLVQITHPRKRKEIHAFNQPTPQKQTKRCF